MYTIKAKQGKPIQFNSVKDVIAKETKITNDKRERENFLRQTNRKLAEDYHTELNKVISPILKERFEISSYNQFSDTVVLELGHAVHNIRVVFTVDLDSGKLNAELRVFYRFYKDNTPRYRKTIKVKSVNNIIKHAMPVINALEISEARMEPEASSKCLAPINEVVINDPKFIKL
mgnify:CR=1 FL=1